MRWYRHLVIWFFAAAFVGGGIAHLVLGRTQPESYAAFARTALIPGMDHLWMTLVMPNIGWLTIVLGVFELACGLGILWWRTRLLAVCAIFAFLVFIVILGYGFETPSPLEDLAVNRLGSIVMIAVLGPLLDQHHKPFKHSPRHREETRRR